MSVGMYSKAGLHHKRDESKNQDALCTYKNNRFAIISLADGVSTQRLSKLGAKVAVETATRLLKNKAEYFLQCTNQDISYALSSHVKFEVEELAKNEGTVFQEYASTLACVLYDRQDNLLVVYSLGDSIILGVNERDYKVILNPSDSTDGCFVTTTKECDTLAKARRLSSNNFDYVMICSDGAWMQLFYQTKLKDDVKKLLCNHDLDGLKKYLDGQGIEDDYSFITIDLKEEV